MSRKIRPKKKPPTPRHPIARFNSRQIFHHHLQPKSGAKKEDFMEGFEEKTKMKTLYRTIVVIWSPYDPCAENVDPEDIGRDAVSGISYCSSMSSAKVENPEQDPGWNKGVADFFSSDGDSEDEQ